MKSFYYTYEVSCGSYKLRYGSFVRAKSLQDAKKAAIEYLSDCMLHGSDRRYLVWMEEENE